MGKRKTKRTLAHHWRRWKYKNTTLLVLSLILFIYLAQTHVAEEVIKQAGGLGYIGAFITGMFFVSTFTAAPAGLVLFSLADNLHPLEVAIMAGLGAMVGDYIIFRLVKDVVFDELKPMLGKLHRRHLRALFKTSYFAWMLPFLGAAIIASPLPDEVGVNMLGLAKIKRWQFFAVTFALNAIGIFLIVAVARL